MSPLPLTFSPFYNFSLLFHPSQIINFFFSTSCTVSLTSFILFSFYPDFTNHLFHHCHAHIHFCYLIYFKEKIGVHSCQFVKS